VQLSVDNLTDHVVGQRREILVPGGQIIKKVLGRLDPEFRKELSSLGPYALKISDRSFQNILVPYHPSSLL